MPSNHTHSLFSFSPKWAFAHTTGRDFEPQLYDGQWKGSTILPTGFLALAYRDGVFKTTPLLSLHSVEVMS